MRVAAFVLALSVGSLLACSSKNSADPPDASGDGSDVVSCDDPREQTYAANLQVAGTNGIFTFVLLSSQPAPPADQTNTFVVQVNDASGQPATGATLVSVTSTMPLMSHGTSEPTIASNGNGQFTVSGVYLFMAGLWEIPMTAESGSQKDNAAFYFCVQG